MVYDADLAAGQNLHFPANDRVEVTVNDASALLLELNGQNVMPARIPGFSSTISLTSTDSRQADGGPPEH
jgi:hypothetical protein